MLVQTPDATLAVDSPLVASAADDGAMAAEALRISRALSILAVNPTAVTHVLITHGHHDHVGGVLTGGGRLRCAQHYFPVADIPGPLKPLRHGVPVGGMLSQTLAAGRLRLTDGDLHVTRQVSLLAAPGETNGQQAFAFNAVHGLFINSVTWSFAPERFMTPQLCFSGGATPMD